MEVTGTLVWYYCICKREVWLMSHSIVPDQHNDNIELGRAYHEQTYQRKEKEISFGNVRFDVLLETKDCLVIGEEKKTSHFQEASKWQLIYYLNVLKSVGIEASGVLLYPKERRRVEVKLTPEAEQQLSKICEEIHTITDAPVPPAASKCKYCRKCGYEEYCWS